MKKLFKKNGLDFDLEFYEKAEKYIKILLDYAKVHNITALKTKEEVWENIFDSVYICQHIDFHNKKICDVGSGAGFPAIALAIAIKDSEFCLYEPIAKKSSFLHLVKARLGLKNVKIKTCRIENERGCVYDIITSRAVSDTEMLLYLCKKVSKSDTKYLFYKGSRVHEEIKYMKNFRVWIRGDRNYLLLRDQVEEQD